MSLKSLPLQKLTPKKSNTPNPKYSHVSPATMAMGTRWVMPQNLGTAPEVLFFDDPARGVTRPLPAAAVDNFPRSHAFDT